jgi:outer membrane receptor protein involved in Fe transport
MTFQKTRLSVAVALAASATLPGVVVAAEDEAQVIEEVVVTGSRIARRDLVANSPITTVDQELIVRFGDTTIDEFLNTLPQINPAGGNTSNNPGNNGQANVDLRGLGANRNLVLIDGRRVMPSQSDMAVDLNTIPAALIENIEVLTGGAGAAYGTDAVAGAVNIKLRDDFEGFELRGSFQDHIEEQDSKDYVLSAVLGGNFDDGRGNAVIALDHADREQMVKAQREFAAVATSTTSFLPEGRFFGSGDNPIDPAAIDALFQSYGSAAGAVPSQNLLAFNEDGSLFSIGQFNSPQDVENFRYPVDGAVNTNLFPDFYSYNFDFVNLLRLPLNRDSIMGKMDYEFDNGIEVFAQYSYTEYSADTALAPTPIPTVGVRAPGEAASNQAVSQLLTPGSNADFTFVVPATNPFIPTDFANLLATRTGDDPRFVGAGATEPFTMRQRTLDAGLRLSSYNNIVRQFTTGASGPLPFLEGWDWSFYLTEGRTRIVETQSGNIDTNRLQTLLEDPSGGADICAGGFNPFGRQPLSQECVDYLEVSSSLTTEFKQQIGQFYVTGDVVDLPAGPLSVVAGYEFRFFDFAFDPGSAGGAISGFNAQDPSGGTNEFRDVFFEALVPLVSGRRWAESVELNLGYRSSESQFNDSITGINNDESRDDAYKVELGWALDEHWRFRGSYQRAVRAPNFEELFDGTGSAPQIFDPCNSFSGARNGPDGAEVLALCQAQDVAGAVGPNFVATPGAQASINLTGNRNLEPETADTFTLGAVMQSPFEGVFRNLTASIDWYSIDVEDAIIVPNVNLIIADCFNYYGNNPTYSNDQESCATIFRAGDILGLSDPNTDSGDFNNSNNGEISTSGIDLAASWGFDAGPGYVNLNALLNHVLAWEQSDGAGLPKIDYAGTVGYFGAGLGQSFPEWNANLTGTYAWRDYTFDTRIRYIGEMDNRAAAQYAGETSLTGVDAITYVDLGASWALTETVNLRLGVNNVFDAEPEEYAPNVQSGTDPSLYDIVGRRYVASFRMRF